MGNRHPFLQVRKSKKKSRKKFKKKKIKKKKFYFKNETFFKRCDIFFSVYAMKDMFKVPYFTKPWKDLLKLDLNLPFNSASYCEVIGAKVQDLSLNQSFPNISKLKKKLLPLKSSPQFFPPIMMIKVLLSTQRLKRWQPII